MLKRLTVNNNAVTNRYNYIILFKFKFIARSISEEFSSDTGTKHKDSEEYGQQPHAPAKGERTKEKDEKDEGI